MRCLSASWNVNEVALLSIILLTVVYFITPCAYRVIGTVCVCMYVCMSTTDIAGLVSGCYCSARPAVPVPGAWGAADGQGDRCWSSYCCSRSGRRQSSDGDLTDTDGLLCLRLLAHPAERPPRRTSTMDWQAAGLATGMSSTGYSRPTHRWEMLIELLSKLVRCAFI